MNGDHGKSIDPLCVPFADFLICSDVSVVGDVYPDSQILPGMQESPFSVGRKLMCWSRFTQLVFSHMQGSGKPSDNK